MSANFNMSPLVSATHLHTGGVILIVPCPRCTELMTLIVDPKPNDDVSLTTTRRRDESVGRVKSVTLAASEVDHACPALAVTP